MNCVKDFHRTTHQKTQIRIVRSHSWWNAWQLCSCAVLVSPFHVEYFSKSFRPNTWLICCCYMRCSPSPFVVIISVIAHPVQNYLLVLFCWKFEVGLIYGLQKAARCSDKVTCCNARHGTTTSEQQNCEAAGHLTRSENEQFLFERIIYICGFRCVIP